MKIAIAHNGHDLSLSATDPAVARRNAARLAQDALDLAWMEPGTITITIETTALDIDALRKIKTELARSTATHPPETTP